MDSLANPKALKTLVGSSITRTRLLAPDTVGFLLPGVRLACLTLKLPEPIGGQEEIELFVVAGMAIPVAPTVNFPPEFVLAEETA